MAEEKTFFPCIPLRGLTIFPNTVMHFDIGRDKSVKALENAMNADKQVFVLSQIDDNVLIPTAKDLYNTGTVIKVKQMLKIQGDAIRVLVEGLYKATAEEIIEDDDFFKCSINPVPEYIKEEEMSTEDSAKLRVLKDSFIKYGSLSGHLAEEVIEKAVLEKSPVASVYKMAHDMAVPYNRKQEILEENDFSLRMDILMDMLCQENEIAEIEKVIAGKVKENVDKNQREYILREKMRAIQEELGVNEDAGIEASEWLEKLKEIDLDEKTEDKVKKEINKFSKMIPSSAEGAVIRNYIETILELPWNKGSETNDDLKRAEKILNEDHYGLEKVKERVLEYLAVIHLTKEIKGSILCLVGPPGVGKTSIAKSIARAGGREFVRMSLGGVRDEAEIRGHRRTYVGAIPGRVISCIKEAGVNNPVFLFDEIDKIGADFKGDPASALLEVLDPEQNNTFTDHFLEVPFDLSKVMFITTANSLDTIPRPLLDRMEVIEVSGYTEEEKVNIAKKYLIDKKVKAHGLTSENIRISDGAVHDIINYYTRESGVRNLEREIANLCRKVARKIVTEGKKSYNITQRNLESFLGKKRYHFDMVEGENQVGVTTGLAWTAVGGDTLQIETVKVPGSGKLSLTGNLGDVMQESAKIGVSYIRSVADKFGIEEDFNKKYDLHIHVPEGAVPKDGPSAGVTMCTAVVSTLTGRAVRRNIAMTGELSLTGKVLPVGGIKEKVLAAHRAGITKILLPKENEADIEEIPVSVRKQLDFVLLDNAEQALSEALVK